MKTDDIDKLFRMTGIRKKGATLAQKTDKPKTPKKVYYDLDDDDEYAPIGVDGLLAASEKLLAVNRGLVDTDERDSWVYKRVYTPDKLIRLRVKMDAGASSDQKLMRSVARRVSKNKDLRSIYAGVFDPYVEGAIIGNPLTMPLEEINPLQLTAQQRRVTHMGPGGINSENALTADMQNVTPSQFGFISTLETPESSRVGVDAKVAWGVKIGSDGRLYQRFRDKRTGKIRWMSPRDLRGMNVGIPD